MILEKAAMENQTVTFNDAELKTALLWRGDSASTIACRDLKRYYSLLKRCLETHNFSEGEARLICEALKGYQLDENADLTGVFWGEIADSISLNQLDKKWGVDGQALIHKFQSLPPGHVFAVVDAVEQFWIEPKSKLPEEWTEELIRVGLIHDCCYFCP